MKQVLHLAKKDLTRHWLLAALVVLAIVLDAFDTRYGLFSTSSTRVLDGLVGSLLKWPLCFLFIAAVVQEDKVAGVTPHWLTRPIHSVALFAAKVLTAVCVIVLPQTVAHGANSHFLGLDSGNIALVAGESFCIALALTMAAIMVCALTRSILEACVWIATGLLGYMALMLLWSGLPASVHNAAPFPSNISGASRLIVAFACGLPAAVGLMIVHYRRRSRAITLASAFAASALIFGIAHQFPWELLAPESLAKRPSVKVPAPDYVPSHLDIVASGNANFGMGDYRYNPETRTRQRGRSVMVRAKCTLAEPNRVIRNSRVTTTLTFSDGSQKKFAPVQALLDRTVSQQALRAALGLPTAAVTTDTQLGLLGLRYGEPAFNQPAQASAELTYEEHAARLVAKFAPDKRILFRAGYVYRAGRPEFHEREGDIALSLRLLTQTSFVRPDGYLSPDAPQPWDLGFVLYHPRLKEYSVSALQRYGSGNSVGLVRIRRSEWVFRSRLDQTGKVVGDVTPEWLAEAEVLVFRTQFLGVAHQTFAIRDLAFPPEGISNTNIW